MKYKLETVNCPLCDSENYRIYLNNAKELYLGMDEYFNIVQCIACDFIFTNPRPTKESIPFFYPKTAGYYKPQDVVDKFTSKKVIKTLLNIYLGYSKNSFTKKIIYFLPWLIYRNNILINNIPYSVQSGRLLDIGCSWGLYLSKMQNLGWDVYGCEFNKESAEYAIHQLGLKNIEICSIENIKYNNDYFDVINLSMVLEHLYNPVQSLKLIHSILKEKGQLILSIPNISGFESLLFKKHFYSLHVPQHLNHFNPKTISEILKKTGFRLDHIIHQHFDRDLISSLNYSNNKVFYKILSNKLIRRTIVKCFLLILALLGKTSRMTVYARKKETEVLTILTVNYNSIDFIKLMIYSFSKLTKNSYKLIICDNGSNKEDIKQLKRIEQKNNNIEVIFRKQTSIGSIGHAEALDILVAKVSTPYFVVMDSDAVFLLKNWDETLISSINRVVKAVGTPPIPSKNNKKYTDFPLMFATLYDTESYKKLKVSFMPDKENINIGMDTGYEIREKYHSIGKKGLCFDVKNTRVFKTGSYGRIICTEYYFNKKLIASHFGRGSSLGNAKYLKNFSIPILGRIFRTIMGIYQKNIWLKTGRKIINNQFKEKTVNKYLSVNQ